MTAGVMRNLVSSIFKFRPEFIELKGEISPDFIPVEDRGHSWWSGAAEQYDSIWGFSPETGFIRIAGGSRTEGWTKDSSTMLSREYSYSNNGDVTHEEGCAIKYHPQADEFLFFIIHSYGKEYGDTGEDFETLSVYKAPNFKEHFDKIEKEDIVRWEQWLNS